MYECNESMHALDVLQLQRIKRLTIQRSDAQDLS